MEDLRQKVNQARDNMLEMWSVAKVTGNIEDFRELLRLTDIYDTLKLQLNQEEDIEIE